MQPFAGHALTASALVLAVWSLRRRPLLFALATWLGTFAHELLHYVAGWIFGARPVGLSVIPRRLSDGSLQLGCVYFVRLRWWNKLPVALAPLALFPIAAWLLWLSVQWPVVAWQSLALQFAAVQCIFSAWPSSRDWRHAFFAAAVIAVLSVLSAVALFWLRVLPAAG